jgi:hypothetical protein
LQFKWWPQRDAIELAQFKCAISLCDNHVDLLPAEPDAH